MATARRSGGNSGSTSASEVGISAAAPTACTTRAAIRQLGSGASPHSTEPARNSQRPPKKSRRWPTRSAIRPAGTSAAAKTMLYALRTQESSLSEASGKSAAIDGNATLTIVTSRKAMNTATVVTSSTCHSRGIRPRRCRPAPPLLDRVPVGLGVDHEHRARREPPHLLGDRRPKRPSRASMPLLPTTISSAPTRAATAHSASAGPPGSACSSTVDVDVGERRARLLERAGHGLARRAAVREAADQVQRHAGRTRRAPPPGVPPRSLTRSHPCP